MKLFVNFSIQVVLTVSLSFAVFAHQKTKPRPQPPSEAELQKLHSKAKKIPPSGTQFSISISNHRPDRFSFLLSEPGGRIVSHLYPVDHINLMEAIMLEVKKFAYSEEAVGDKKPTITRFYDKNFPSFAVDVSKIGNKSQVFITLVNLNDKITIDAGTIRRNEKDGKAMFLDLLARVEAAAAGRWSER